MLTKIVPRFSLDLAETEIGTTLFPEGGEIELAGRYVGEWETYRCDSCPDATKDPQNLPPQRKRLFLNELSSLIVVLGVSKYGTTY